MPKKNLTTKLADVEASLKRWQTRLKKATNKVTELDKQRRRYQLALLSEGQPVVATVRVKVPVEPEPAKPLAEILEPEEIAELQQVNQELSDALTIPKEFKRDPNADALKAMNRRIEQRAASRKQPKAKPQSRLIAKAMAERDAIEQTVKQK